MIKIIRTIKDLAGKIRVFVEVAEGEATMFKFDKKPTDMQIENEIQKQAEAKEKEKQIETEIK